MIITPHLWFDTQAKEAVDYYLSVFPHSKILSSTTIHDVPSPSGDSDVISFELNGQPFMAINAGPYFTFNEAISFIIPCETQEEIDYYWGKLSKVPAAEQCGWCKDQFGISWQVWPTFIGKIMGSGDAEKIAKLSAAFLHMKKFDLAALEQAAA